MTSTLEMFVFVRSPTRRVDSRERVHILPTKTLPNFHVSVGLANFVFRDKKRTRIESPESPEFGMNLARTWYIKFKRL